MGYPSTCDICVREKVCIHWLRSDLQLAVQPFIGTNPKIMLVGQDPTLTQRDVSTVLELDNQTSLDYSRAEVAADARRSA
jgi:hypothetical protein